MARGQLGNDQAAGTNAGRSIVCQEQTATATGGSSPSAECQRISAPSWCARGWPRPSCATAPTTLAKRPRRRPAGSACMRTAVSRRGSGGRSNGQPVGVGLHSCGITV